MKRIILCLMTLLLVTIFTACGLEGNISTETPSSAENSEVSVMMLKKYMTFEEALLLSSNVVVAQYVGYRNFGDETIEFEFAVLESVLGDSADRIFVYARNANESIMARTSIDLYNNTELNFRVGGQYLLVLRRIWSPHRKVQENGYNIVSNIVIDLENPQNSSMYNEPLYLHSELDFRRGRLSEAQIIDYVREITKNNPPPVEYVMSSCVTEIVEGSDYILLIEVNELRSMARTDIQHTDIFYCTVVQVIKGALEPGFELAMVFLADTVRPGEQHIIAVRRVGEGSSMFKFTSRYSLFEIEQFDEIMAVLAQQQ